MRRFAVLGVAGVVLIGLGAWLAFARPVEFGWFAYAPLADEPYVPELMVLDTVALLGLLLAVVGLVTVAGTAGYVLGRRRRPGDAQTEREKA